MFNGKRIDRLENRIRVLEKQVTELQSAAHIVVMPEGVSRIICETYPIYHASPVSTVVSQIMRHLGLKVAREPAKQESFSVVEIEPTKKAK